MPMFGIEDDFGDLSTQLHPNDNKRYMTAEHESTLNIDHFPAIVRKYTDIQELTAEMLREIVEKVIVYKDEQINGKRVQRIGIVWNCIGKFTPPAPTPAPEQEKTA